MHEDYAGEKLCIIISKNDKYEGIVLYELLLEIAFNSRLSGGTVTIGDKGFFGAHDESTRLKILRSAENLPVVLEFHGTTKRIDRYIERIQPMIKEGLLTRADVWITKISSTDEDTDPLQDQENEDQSQIFNADVEEADIPESPPSSQESQVSGTEAETLSPAEELERDQNSKSEFLELDQDQPTEQDEVDIAEPQIEIPSFDDDGDGSKPTPESFDIDQENIREDVVNEVPDPLVEEDSFVGADENEDESEIPSFQSMDENHSQNDAPEAESDAFIDEDDDDAPVYQLADLSETQAEESSADTFEMDDPAETAEDTSDGTEFTEQQTEADIDKLFDESNAEFENTFDDRLKEAVGAGVVDTDIDSAGKTTPDKEPDDSSGAEESESASEEAKTYDKNHTEEDMKNYFSALFKKGD